MGLWTVMSCIDAAPVNALPDAEIWITCARCNAEGCIDVTLQLRWSRKRRRSHLRCCSQNANGSITICTRPPTSGTGYRGPGMTFPSLPFLHHQPVQHRTGAMPLLVRAGCLLAGT